MQNKDAERALNYLSTAQSLDRPKTAAKTVETYIAQLEKKLEQIERAFKFFGEDWGYSVGLESDGNGFADMVIREEGSIERDIFGKGSIERQSYTDAFLEASLKARAKATREDKKFRVNIE